MPDSSSPDILKAVRRVRDSACEFLRKRRQDKDAGDLAEDFARLERAVSEGHTQDAVAIIDKWHGWCDVFTYILELTPGVGFLVLCRELEELKKNVLAAAEEVDG